MKDTRFAKLVLFANGLVPLVLLLWDVWRKPDGKKVESFTIITTEPNDLIQPIHNRMPVILQPEDEEQWLDVSRTTFAKPGHC